MVPLPKLPKALPKQKDSILPMKIRLFYVRDKLEILHNLMKNLGWTAEQAMAAMGAESKKGFLLCPNGI